MRCPEEAIVVREEERLALECLPLVVRRVEPGICQQLPAAEV